MIGSTASAQARSLFARALENYSIDIPVAQNKHFLRKIVIGLIVRQTIMLFSPPGSGMQQFALFPTYLILYCCTAIPCASRHAIQNLYTGMRSRNTYNAVLICSTQFERYILRALHAQCSWISFYSTIPPV